MTHLIYTLKCPRWYQTACREISGCCISCDNMILVLKLCVLVPDYSNVHSWLCSFLAGVNFVEIPETWWIVLSHQILVFLNKWYLATLFLALVIMAYWGHQIDTCNKKYISQHVTTDFTLLLQVHNFSASAVQAKESSVKSLWFGTRKKKSFFGCFW